MKKKKENKEMSREVIVSPIFYMGCKKKLIKKGLVELFPKDINTFVDLFGGSGIVSMNVKADKYMLNDSDNNLYKLYSYFKLNNAEKIVGDIKRLIINYKLEEKAGTKFSYDNRSKFYNKELAFKHKKAYMNLRTDYNKSKDMAMLYTLLIYCFCHQLRFNSKGEFNMPCGNGNFTVDNIKDIYKSQEFFRNDNLSLTNKSFNDLKIDKLKVNDFVYLDPPYLNTTATYNENGGWTIDNEKELQRLCERLNDNNIKWAMSNAFENKGVENSQLVDWCVKNNWNIIYFDKHTYSALGKGNSKTIEVLITNYVEEKR